MIPPINPWLLSISSTPVYTLGLEGKDASMVLFYDISAYLLATLHDTQASLQFDFIWGLLLSILLAEILLVTLLSSRIETSNNT